MTVEDASWSTPSRLRLGHIVYSNCFPVHGMLFDRPCPGDPALIAGIPSQLNRMLREGGLDVAPSSSIEYAHNSDRYRILPDLVIGSKGAVRSIVLVSDRPPNELSGHVVAIPTASATSVLLLKILLRIRWNARPELRWFDQASQHPLAAGASAALFIGDVALRVGLNGSSLARFDLGLEWWEETGLPFAFALWQAGSGSREALRQLHERLLESRAWSALNRRSLAERYSSHFGIPADDLDRYWSDLSYQL
ncbi:MAG: futalosine synthase, partial [Gemmatimonas sp.]|nr:futalosine synthase [Gemmatimonas sp.]